MRHFVNKNYKQIIGIFGHFVTPTIRSVRSCTLESKKVKQSYWVILNQEEGARFQFSLEGAAADE